MCELMFSSGCGHRLGDWETAKPGRLNSAVIAKNCTVEIS